MTVSQDSAHYFVVGGPVQPDRQCYVLRDADAVLYARVSDGEYCHVLAPADMGKTSLMAHVANRLRADGVAVAAVDLTQISNRGMGEDLGRWYYSAAYRLVRELRIRTDMQSWWQERSGLTNLQRLRDFLLDVVLASCEGPVVIFVDRVEAALGLDAARDLFGAVRACHDARATEPEYRRLTFVLIGAPSAGQRLPAGQASPFDVSTAVPLTDFEPDEMGRLAAGLPCEPATARRLAERVHYWTGGHPYLSQKLMRYLARRRTPEALEAADVDRGVATLFVTRNATRDEPHLSVLAAQVLAESPQKVARLTLYGRVRKGLEVSVDPLVASQRDLIGCGLLVAGAARRLAVRNRVYAAVFTAQWVNQNLPFSWRGLGIAAAVLLLVVSIPVWYTEYLPRPYVRTLQTPDIEFVAAQEAWERLGFLPGFGRSADQLFAEYLVAQGSRATRLMEVQRFGEKLGELPGGQDARAEMLAEFWDRQAREALERGDRDAAILYRLRALERPTEPRRLAAGELLGDDIRSLAGTIRTPEPQRTFAIDPASGLVSTLDASDRIGVWQFADGGARRLRTLELVAEEVTALQARLLLQDEVPGRRLVATFRTDHPRPADVLVELRAPSGLAVRVPLDAGQPTGQAGEFRLDSRRVRALAPLLEESAAGSWTAYLTDRLPGLTGQLLEWTLSVDGREAVSLPGAAEPAPIPEPRVARQAITALGPLGQRALSWPRDPAARGDVLVWNIANGEVIARIPRPPDFAGARFARGNAAVLIDATRGTEIWDADGGTRRATIPVERSLAPVLSANGRFLVADSLSSEGDNVLTVWDIERGKAVGRLVTGALAPLAATDPAGRVLAVSDGERLVRLWSVTGGTLLGELAHGATPAALHFDASGNWLATEDAAHTLRLWNLQRGGPPVLVEQSAAAWAVSFDADHALLGSLGRGFSVVRLADGARRGPVMRLGGAFNRDDEASGQAALLVSKELVVTLDGVGTVKGWRLPPALDSAAPATAAAAVTRSAIGPGAGRIAMGTTDGDVRIQVAPDSGPVLARAAQGPGFIGHLAPVTALAFGPDGGTVASGALDGSIRFWDADSGAPQAVFAAHGEGAVQDLLFTPSGAALITAGRRLVMVTDAATGEPLARLPVQGERPRIAAGASDARVYVAADRDGVLRWSWRDNVVEPLLGAAEGIERLALDGEGRLLATADTARRVRLWRAGDLAPLSERVRLAARADELWFPAGDRLLLVRAGLWLYELQVTADGLRHRATRFLPGPPDAMRVADGDTDVLLLQDAGAGRPSLRRIAPGWPLGPALTEDPASLRARLESLLQLRLDERGEPRPL